jgi:hypothetical protein
MAMNSHEHISYPYHHPQHLALSNADHIKKQQMFVFFHLSNVFQIIERSCLEFQCSVNYSSKLGGT